MKRTSIPDRVKAQLRKEVGFGCPVKGCGNPYLEYHHFDPPISVRPHNEPSGMIALCAQHHKKADGGLYTVGQLHELKSDKANAALVMGNLDWLRKDLLAVVGGSFFYKVPRILVVDNVDVVALHKDEDGYLRLSINMLSLLPEERIVIDRNEWRNIGSPLDLRCPPQGKELEVIYDNGDFLHLRFFVIDDFASAIKKYPDASGREMQQISYPLTCVEVNFRAEGSGIDVTPSGAKLYSGTVKGSFISNCGGGIALGTPHKWLQNSKPAVPRAIHIPNTNVVRVDFCKVRKP